MVNANLQIFALVKLAGKERFVKYVFLCLVAKMETVLELLNVIVPKDGQEGFVKFVSYNSSNFLFIVPLSN